MPSKLNLNTAMKYLDLLLSSIAPHHCIGCRKEGEICCQNCLEQIRDPHASRICYLCSKPIKCSLNGICKKCYKHQSLDSVVWYSDYSFSATSMLVKSLKFENLYNSSKIISKAILSLVNNVENIEDKNQIIITSAPTAGSRARKRGWDQARIIAKSSAKSKKLKYRQLLIRVSSFDQIGSTKLQRSQESKKFFKPYRKLLIKNSTIILIDDVVTTGSTLNSAASVLKQAGAKEVHALAFARQGLKKVKK